MYFEGTPLNMTTVLVAVLAIVAVLPVLRKRYDSNLPLFFYLIAVMFTSFTDRDINGFLLYTGLAFALLLRFEFLNQGFGKIVAFCTAGSMGLIIYILVVEAFGDGAPPF
jgi:predicted cation transporter